MGRAPGRTRLTVGLDARLLRSERQPTGVGYYARELTRHLAPLVNLHLYTEAALGPLASDVAAPELVTVHAERRWPGLPWQQTALVAGLWRQRPQLYHSPTFTLPRWAPCPTVVTIHDLAAVTMPEWANAQNRRYLERMLPWAVHHADRVIAVSARVRQEIVAHFGLSGADARRIATVGLGVDATRFRLQPPEVLDAWRQQRGIVDPYLVFVGTREPRKNLVRLVTAFNIARRHHPRATLLLVGAAGFGTAALDQVVARTPGVRVMDYVHDGEVPLLLQGAAALCYVSLYEGFGLPVLEAMALGTPVVTSADTVMQDTTGGHALYVNPLDTDSIAATLARVLADPPSFRQAAAPHVAYARALSWNRTARETVLVYQDACRT